MFLATQNLDGVYAIAVVRQVALLAATLSSNETVFYRKKNENIQELSVNMEILRIKK